MPLRIYECIVEHCETAETSKLIFLANNEVRDLKSLPSHFISHLKFH